MPNQASDSERGMKSMQTELEEDLGTFQIQSEKAARENLHADKRRLLHAPAEVFLELMRLLSYIFLNFMFHFTSGTL